MHTAYTVASQSTLGTCLPTSLCTFLPLRAQWHPSVGIGVGVRQSPREIVMRGVQEFTDHTQAL